MTKLLRTECGRLMTAKDIPVYKQYVRDHLSPMVNTLIGDTCRIVAFCYSPQADIIIPPDKIDLVREMFILLGFKLLSEYDIDGIELDITNITLTFQERYHGNIDPEDQSAIDR